MPVPVKRRVRALKEVQGQYDELMRDFIRERAELQAKYEKAAGACVGCVCGGLCGRVGGWVGEGEWGRSRVSAAPAVVPAAAHRSSSRQWEIL